MKALEEHEPWAPPFIFDAISCEWVHVILWDQRPYLFTPN